MRPFKSLLRHRHHSDKQAGSDPKPTPSSHTTEDLTVRTPAQASDPAPETLRARLWNRAYEKVKAGDTLLVDKYERLLSCELSKSSEKFIDPSTQGNTISEDPSKRWEQMQQLVRNGLNRTEKYAKAGQMAGEALAVFDSVKDIASAAIQACPQAAVAWTGVCFALEILANPVSEATSSRSGLGYVVTRMKWYWKLSELLLDENRTKHNFSDFRDVMEEHVIELYSSLLEYQMKGIIYTYRNRFAAFARDVVKLDDWDGQLDEVKTLESSVRNDSEQFNTLQIRSALESIAENSQIQLSRLSDVDASVRNQTKQMMSVDRTREDNKCLADLRITNPRDDKARIEADKGGLLRDCYIWFFRDPTYQQWQQSKERNILWINGHAGQGKTMLVCGMISEMEGSADDRRLTAYFFCQQSDSRINNAVSILRGLVYTIIDQRPNLISHLRKEYDRSGKSIFEDVNAWHALSKILINILSDGSLGPAVIMIDALDECTDGRDKILKLVANQSKTLSHVHWILSSRPWPEIQRKLSHAENLTSILLESTSSSTLAAVSAFIDDKVNHLAEENDYDDETRQAVKQALNVSANGTFLWVALVCEALHGVDSWDAAQQIERLPPKLNGLYETMLRQIIDLPNSGRMKSILAVMTLVRKPVSLPELQTLVQELDSLPSGMKPLRDLIARCRSFLFIRSDTVFLVHQSAKDFLTDNENATKIIFPDGEHDVHWRMFRRSLEKLSLTLKRDIYDLRKPGIRVEDITKPQPDPLAPIVYSCMFWIDHLSLCEPESSPERDRSLEEIVLQFIKTRSLYWLEALALIGEMSAGIRIARRLHVICKAVQSTALRVLSHDLERFVRHNRVPLETAPLQAYSSVLMFSPYRCSIRNAFERDLMSSLNVHATTEEDWSQEIQSLDRHTHSVHSLTFSKSGQLLTSASSDQTVRLWDPSTGEELHCFRLGLFTYILWQPQRPLAFSGDGRLLAMHSEILIQLWETSTGELLSEFKNNEGAYQLLFSNSDQILACSSKNRKEIRLWYIHTEKEPSILHSDSEIIAMAFSWDDSILATASRDEVVVLFNVAEEKVIRILENFPVSSLLLLAWSKVGYLLAGGCSYSGTIQVWDLLKEKQIHELRHECNIVSLAFSCNDQLLVYTETLGFADRSVHVWDLSNGSRVLVISAPFGSICIALSHDGDSLAFGMLDGTIRLWDTPVLEQACDTTRDQPRLSCVALSSCGRLAAGGSLSGTIHVWDPTTGKQLKRFEAATTMITDLDFSYSGNILASRSHDMTTRLWDHLPERLVLELKDSRVDLSCVCISRDDQILAARSWTRRTIQLWSLLTGQLIRKGFDHADFVTDVAFSHDSQLLASTCDLDMTVYIWCVSTGRKIHKIEKESICSSLGSADHQISDTRAEGIQPPEHSSRSVKNLDVGMIEPDAFPEAWGRNNDPRSWSRALKLSRPLVHVKFAEPNKLLVHSEDDRPNVVGSLAIFNVADWKRLQMIEVCNEDFNKIASGGIALSLKGRLLGMKSYTGNIQLWDLFSRKSLLESEGNSRDDLSSRPYRLSSRLAFNEAEDRLLTDTGCLQIHFEESSAGPIPIALRRAGLGLRDHWITRDGEDLLWLPPDYRYSKGSHSKFACYDDTIFLAGNSGAMLLISLKGENGFGRMNYL